MAYTTIDKPSDYFNTVLYTGNGGTQSITGVGFQPDWIFLKPRSQSGEHGLSVDSVRGNTKVVFLNLTNAEQTITNIVTAFGSDGFSLGDNAGANNNTSTYVAWNWKAGTSFTNDASSTGIGATDSAGSVNDTAGFSICTYTGVGGTSTTIKHGLSTAPTVMLIKNRDDGDDWAVYHQGIGNTHRLYLNLTDGATSAIGTFRNTSPTSSIFTVGDHASVNISGEKYVAYIFAEKKGYSKLGSFAGNGSATDGVYIHLGFKAAWFMCKRTNASGHDWVIFNNKALGYNPDNNTLLANDDSAEGTADRMDILSNGVKMYNNNGSENESGGEYIYMAFAENPFVTSTGVPATAR